MEGPEILTPKMPLSAAEVIHTPLIMINPYSIEFDLRSGDLSLLVQSLQTQASSYMYQVQVAVLTSGFQSVALLIC